MRFLALLSAIALFVITVAIAATQIQEPLFPGDRATFVKDVNYPDGTEVKAGSKIVKTWRIHNRGMVAWKDRELRLAGETQGFTVKSVPFSGNSTKDVDVSVELIVPKTPGQYKLTFKQWAKDADGKWKLAFPDRYRSGVYIEITVVK